MMMEARGFSSTSFRFNSRLLLLAFGNCVDDDAEAMMA
jgi:hypothetical protein